MSRKIYSVTVRWIETPMNAELIDRALGSIGDWLRLNAFQWYICTDKTGKEIFSVVAPNLKTGDSLVIVGVDHPEVWGHANKSVWEWFASHGARFSA